jgi:hypothetical protein
VDSSLKTKPFSPTVTQHKPATVKDKTLVKLYKRIAIYAIGTTTVTNVCPPVNPLLEVLRRSQQRNQQRSLLLLATTVKLTRISAQVVSGVQLANMASAPLGVRVNAHTTRATTEIVQVMETSQFADATGPLTKMPVMHKLLV